MNSNNLTDVEIIVRYLGIIRLLTGRQTDVLILSSPATLKDAVEALRTQLPSHVFAEIERQTLLLSPRPNMPGNIISLTDDAARVLQTGNCLTIVTPVTGG